MNDRMMFRAGVIALTIACAVLVLVADWMEDSQFKLASFASLLFLIFGVVQILRSENVAAIPAHKLRPIALFALAALAVAAGLWLWGAMGGADSDWFAVVMVTAPAILLIGGAIYGGTRKPPGSSR